MPSSFLTGDTLDLNSSFFLKRQCHLWSKWIFNCFGFKLVVELNVFRFLHVRFSLVYFLLLSLDSYLGFYVLYVTTIFYFLVFPFSITGYTLYYNLDIYIFLIVCIYIFYTKLGFCNTRKSKSLMGPYYV